MVTEDELIHELETRVDLSTQRAVAESLGVAPQFLCDVLNRRRNVSATLARALGYRREFVFIPLRKEAAISSKADPRKLEDRIEDLRCK